MNAYTCARCHHAFAATYADTCPACTRYTAERVTTLKAALHQQIIWYHCVHCVTMDLLAAQFKVAQLYVKTVLGKKAAWRLRVLRLQEKRDEQMEVEFV
ncbi:MAG: hypothetical protein GY832_25985 [Chloroflexi bacterium]|nr:hypothetical protein [Chloroflexota bacterium]